MSKLLNLVCIALLLGLCGCSAVFFEHNDDRDVGRQNKDRSEAGQEDSGLPAVVSVSDDEKVPAEEPVQVNTGEQNPSNSTSEKDSLGKPSSDSPVSRNSRVNQAPEKQALILRKDSTASKADISTPGATPDSVNRLHFLRSSVVASAIDVEIYDISNELPVYVGRLKNDAKIVSSYTTGRYLFMVVGDSVDYLYADLSANKDYFAIVKPVMGAWKPHFRIWAVKANSLEKSGQQVAAVSEKKSEEGFSLISEVIDQPLNTMLQTTVSASRIEAVKQLHLENWEQWKDSIADEVHQKTLTSIDGQ